MIRPVGTFGGYEGRALRWLPDRHGLLTFAVRGAPSAVSLHWSFGASGEIELGQLARARRSSTAPAATAAVRGWVTLEQDDGDARLLVSRAWPALRCHHRAGSLRWRTSATQLLTVVSGRAQVLGRTRLRSAPSEPWLLLFGHAGHEDFALLITLGRRPASIELDEGGLELTLDDDAAIQVMPLEGLRRRPRDAPSPIDHWIACARAWVSPLLAFPIGCREVARIRGDQVIVEAELAHEAIEDDWGNRGAPLAPYPPSIALAAAENYPVVPPHDLVVDDAQLGVATFYGPFQFVRGTRYTFALPAAVELDGAADRPRSRAPWAAPIREELARIIDAIGDPAEGYVDNNLRVVHFLADALPELEGPARERARDYTARTLASALTPLFEAGEPLTGQRWWTLAKTWRSHFAPTDPPWAQDHERFDSEFYNGQALGALAAAARIDPELVSPHLEQARRLDVYNALFRDWATGSVLTHATGESSNIDGVQFAWEGMLAAAELARLAGDEEWRLDALYRAARQQAALYAMWCLPAWVRDCDYAIGHVSKGRLSREQVETIGPVDALVEEYGSATLEFRSFWQTTNFLFYANRPLFELYRRYGLTDRIRSLEYEVMPTHHPRWFDGHATNPDGENGQERYGAAWTAAHLAARASLFDDDPLELFQLYLATKDTPAAQTWYRMQLPQIAGPLLLVLLETSGPPDVRGSGQV